MAESIIDKYLNIPFREDGKDFDGVYCYGLCQLFYKIEKNIVLPETFELQKLCERIQAPEKHCFVTFTDLCSKGQSHIGIMIDDIRFLHISNNLKRSIPFPVIEKMTNRIWKMRLYGYFRIKKNANIDRI